MGLVPLSSLLYIVIVRLVHFISFRRFVIVGKYCVLNTAAPQLLTRTVSVHVRRTESEQSVLLLYGRTVILLSCIFSISFNSGCGYTVGR